VTVVSKIYDVSGPQSLYVSLPSQAAILEVRNRSETGGQVVDQPLEYILRISHFFLSIPDIYGDGPSGFE
jgi:hypothetical protein